MMKRKHYSYILKTLSAGFRFQVFNDGGTYMNDDFNNGLGPAAWGLFSATGGIGYYLLFKELTGEHDPDKVDKRFE
ncbi:hypothetical protein FACS1894211_11310 [Clostridia bacterium]|nr:hypothetical protein FACS1894211_11310 [Clostridia bacterium]